MSLLYICTKILVIFLAVGSMPVKPKTSISLNKVLLSFIFLLIIRETTRNLDNF